MTTAASILPNALGAEIFLMVETETLSPLVLELIGGEAFRPKHFSSLIDKVDAAVQDALKLIDGRVLAWPRLMQDAQMRRAAFARLLVVGSDATFLYFPNGTAQTARGKRFNLVSGDDREIDYYFDGGDCVCFDGWVRTEVIVSERVLVSLPERTP